MSFGSAGDRVRIDFEERDEADKLGDAATCFTSGVPHPTVRISIRLGAGADTYVAPPGLCAPGGFPAVPMSITVDGQGGNDRISGTGEQGTAASDAVRNETLLGGAGDDRITGSDVASTIGGDSGNDNLFGNGGDDKLIGGTGLDFLSGGGGNDRLESEDGEADLIACGPGADVLIADLVDQQPLDCEAIATAAVDDGAPSRALATPLRLDAKGTATVALLCPKQAEVACAGTLTVTDTATRSRAYGTGRYSVRVGGKAEVKVPLGASAEVVRAAKRVAVLTREQGISKKGPRSSVMTLRVQR